MPTIPVSGEQVLLIAESLRPGGISGYAVQMLRGLAEAGLRPRLCTPEQPSPGVMSKGEEAALGVFPGLLGGFFRPFALRRTLEWINPARPILVHGLSAFTASAAQRLAEHYEVPCVLSVHHYQQSGDLRIGPSCRRLLACSEAIRENLVIEARMPKELIRVVPIGIRVPEPLPEEPHPPERIPVVATFSKLTPRKDLATFLRAARRVLDTRPGACQFLVLGEGPEESALRKLARELKLEKQLTFSHGGVPEDAVLRDLDVYVQTSKQEGFGYSVLQAMAWARPVVATSVGGLISLVRDGQTGYLVPVGDPEAVAARILDLLADPAQRARLGAAGRALAAEKFGLSAMITDTIEVYGQILGWVAPGPGGSGPRPAVRA